jgi:hypothetical protein
MITIIYFVFNPPFRKKYFQNEKREKRKQEISGLRMRSAISPEGWRSHYARAAYDGHYLSCPFSPFRVEI